MSDTPFVGLDAATTNDQALRQSGVAAQWLTGTATSNTDEDGTVQVLVDAPETLTVDDGDEPTDTPVIARCPGGYVASGERVHLLFTGGSLFVWGSGGDGGEGQPRTIGAASIAPTTDIAIASTAAVAITDLDADCSVLHPGHLIRVEVNVHLQSGGAANTLTGRIMRIDSEGNSVEVGRFLRSSALANNQTIQAGVPVKDFSPELGDYTYEATVQASVTGWTLVLDPATSPLTVASLTVHDDGPLPVSYASS